MKTTTQAKTVKNFCWKEKLGTHNIITTVSSFYYTSYSRIVLTNLTFLLCGAIARPVIPDF